MRFAMPKFTQPCVTRNGTEGEASTWRALHRCIARDEIENASSLRSFSRTAGRWAFIKVEFLFWFNCVCAVCGVCVRTIFWRLLISRSYYCAFNCWWKSEFQTKNGKRKNFLFIHSIAIQPLNCVCARAAHPHTHTRIQPKTYFAHFHMKS